MRATSKDNVKKTEQNLGDNFANACYELLNEVPKGRVTTYKAIANALDSKAYRAVGTAMKNNPNAPKTPCHRVIKSDGKVGLYAYGIAKKIELLRGEGVDVIDDRVVNWNEILYDFKKR